jgi:hypothetical protein
VVVPGSCLTHLSTLNRCKCLQTRKLAQVCSVRQTVFVASSPGSDYFNNRTRGYRGNQKYAAITYSFCSYLLTSFLSVRRDKLLALMERLDSQYAEYKKASKDTSKTEEERAAAADKLSDRESLLMPTYKQIALLYADLHE